MAWNSSRSISRCLTPRSAAKPYPVRIEAEDVCGRFTARVLRGISVGESRDWFPGAEVATYFGLLEQKHISNAVDATNFAWLAMGQPTHAFDLDKIEGGIVVRRARKGEKLKTLDGVERMLDPEDLVVADHAKPLGLAGVMGGWDTMITAVDDECSGRSRLVRSDGGAPHSAPSRPAHRRQPSLRARRGLQCRAGRFGPRQPHSACQWWLASKATSSMCAFPHAEARTAQRKPIALALSEVHRILGATVDAEGITAATVEDVLTALGCELAATAQSPRPAWNVVLPSWRLDLEREIDLIEEVARVYGYNRFANTLPAFGEGVRALPWAESEAAVRRTLLAAGFHEAIASTFCSAAEAALTAPQPGLAVPLGNPLSEEAGVLRPSLVPGMLTMIAGNLHRDVSDVRLFELGTVFSGTTEKVEERPALAFGAVGSLPEQGCASSGARDRISRRKGRGRAGARRVSRRAPSTSIAFLPRPASRRRGCIPIASARAVVDGVTVGWFGQLHPREAAARKLKEPVLVGELYLDRLYKLPLRQPVAREISRFQPVRRDFSLVLDESIPVGDDRPGACCARNSRAGRVARARGLSRCPARRARVLAAAGRHLSGPGSHPARRRAARASKRIVVEAVAKAARACGLAIAANDPARNMPDARSRVIRVR